MTLSALKQHVARTGTTRAVTSSGSTCPAESVT
jgi:hypothetical protein